MTNMNLLNLILRFIYFLTIFWFVLLNYNSLRSKRIVELLCQFEPG